MTIEQGGPQDRPSHVESTLRSIVRLHAEHEQNASPQQRLVAAIADGLGRPIVVIVLALVVVLWIGSNLVAPFFGRSPFDPPPFPWLQGALELVSLFAVLFVLGAQRHDDQLNKQRDLLELELALLSEQKTAKVIQLLEELRRDSPHIRDRVDHAADSMSRPADPQMVIDTIRESQARGTPIK